MCNFLPVVQKMVTSYSADLITFIEISASDEVHVRHIVHFYSRVILIVVLYEKCLLKLASLRILCATYFSI